MMTGAQIRAVRGFLAWTVEFTSGKKSRMRLPRLATGSRLKVFGAPLVCDYLGTPTNRAPVSRQDEDS
jgi:hypothetical protein